MVEIIEKLDQKVESLRNEKPADPPKVREGSLTKLRNIITETNMRVSQVMNENKLLYTSIMNTDTRINEVNATLKVVEDEYQSLKLKYDQTRMSRTQNFISLSDQETSDREDKNLPSSSPAKRIIDRKLKNRLKK